MIARLPIGGFLLSLALLFSCFVVAAEKPFPTVSEFQQECINKKLLLAVLGAASDKDLGRIDAEVQLADRDVQRLYYTKLYKKEPSEGIGLRLLDLMPQGRLDSLQFYVYTYLYDERGDATNWIGHSEATQASDLYYEYYDLVWKLVLRNPKFLDRFLVMLRWVSDNAEMAEFVEDWNPALRKAFGKRYDEEKRRVWGILDRPYDPPVAARN